jgi:hypothetical protein
LHYILEGICKAIDGSHVLAVIKTGGGKTGYFYGYMLLLKALQMSDNEKSGDGIRIYIINSGMSEKPRKT